MGAPRPSTAPERGPTEFETSLSTSAVHTHPDMTLTVGSRLGHYDVTALIGEGGMGQEYLSRDARGDTAAGECPTHG